ncbi:unnamed protein product [Arctia plantaginis]|uniref:Protein kinase domain-containing protein n=1 Tax=Arctia plantaginis TaxID=874455 RepID=A0A8S0YNS9_ARCPL|nr:unnamed protein product [Arctia plantaginis]CAB3261552.1 unnamed protein product [Arctia plantaginis]
MSVVKGKLMKMEVVQVGEYEFTKQDIIGHGAFAMVYKGRKRKNPSQSVAVKVVTKKGIQKASEILVKEIKILRELTALHHTNLVAMHDCMDSPAFVYVVMEDLEAIFLKQRLKQLPVENNTVSVGYSILIKFQIK